MDPPHNKGGLSMYGFHNKDKPAMRLPDLYNETYYTATTSLYCDRSLGVSSYVSSSVWLEILSYLPDTNVLSTAGQTKDFLLSETEQHD